MAKKKMRSMLSQQREKLKAQKAAKAAKQAKAPKLPPGKKGGAIVKAKSSSLGSPRRGQAAARARAAAKGTKGTTTRVAGGKGLPKQTPKLPPASKTKAVGKAIGKVAKPLAPALKGIARVAGPLALGISGVQTASDLAGSLKRGEGIVRLAKGLGKKKDKPTVTSRDRRGRPKTTKPKVKPAKRGMSNIPPKEGTGKGSPTDKKPTSGTKSPKPTSKPATGASRRPSASSKPAASKRNNTDVPSNAKSNPYRMPQGKERKDKSYKAVQELKAMRQASKKRQNAQMPKKPAGKKLSKNAQNLRRRRGM
jgi:hypothetical protein